MTLVQIQSVWSDEAWKEFREEKDSLPLCKQFWRFVTTRLAKDKLIYLSCCATDSSCSRSQPEDCWRDEGLPGEDIELCKTLRSICLEIEKTGQLPSWLRPPPQSRISAALEEI